MVRETDIHQVIAAFRSALADAGYLPKEIVPDGKIRRFATSDDEGGEKSGFYRLTNGALPSGSFGDWRNQDLDTGYPITTKWRYFKDTNLTPDELAELAAAEAAAQEQLEAAQAVLARATKINAAQALYDSGAEDSAHPYLAAKRLDKAYGTRVERKTLLVPYYAPDSSIQAVERIYQQDGLPGYQKRFLGSVSGSFGYIGSAQEDVAADAILCEGFATAASVWEAVNKDSAEPRQVLFTGGSGNLITVAQSFKDTGIDTASMLIAGDCTDPRKLNSGVVDKSRQTAERAADILCCDFITPDFTGLELADVPHSATDFNDLHALVGLETVNSQLADPIMSIGKLVSLPAIDYERIRKQAANRLDVPVKSLDKLVRDHRRTSAGNNGAEGATGDKSKISSRIVNLAIAAGISLWTDAEDNAWATIPIGTHRENHALTGRSLRRWLQGLYRKAYGGKMPGKEGVQEALDSLEGIALHDIKRTYKTFVRIAETPDAIFWDLCNETWEVVRVTGDGWTVIPSNACPVKFRRPQGLLPLPTPIRSPIQALNKLSEHINIKLNSPSWRLAIGWLLMAFRGDLPYPVLQISGEQGSGKSTLAKILRTILDPQVVSLNAMPKNGDNLIMAVLSGWIMAYDNASGIQAWLSDLMCVLATGGGIRVRELYTTDVFRHFDGRRPQLITGITDVATRADLVDRSILIQAVPLAPDDRRSETEILRAFAADHAEILGALLEVVSVGLRNLPHVALPTLPRMADFALWLTACESALGWERGAAVADYTKARQDMSSDLLANDLVACAIVTLIETGNFNDTASVLLEKLIAVAIIDEKHPPRGWPASPDSLARRLVRIAPEMRAHGIDITHYRASDAMGSKIWKIVKLPTTPPNNDPPKGAPTSPGNNEGGETILSNKDRAEESEESEESEASKNGLSTSDSSKSKESEESEENTHPNPAPSVDVAKERHNHGASGPILSTCNFSDSSDSLKKEESDPKATPGGLSDSSDSSDSSPLSFLETPCAPPPSPKPTKAKAPERPKTALPPVPTEDTAKIILDGLGVTAVYIRSESDAKQAIEALLALPPDVVIGLDIETAPLPEYAHSKDAGLDPYKSAIRTVQLYAPSSSSAFVLDMHSIDPKVLAPLFQARRFVAHNVAFESKFIIHYYGVSPPLDCTRLMARLTSPDGSDMRLAAVAKQHLGLTVDKALQMSDWSAETLSPAQISYAALDAVLPCSIKDKLVAQLEATGQLEVYRRIQPLISVIARQELFGIGFNAAAHQDVIVDMEAALADATQQVTAALGVSNPASPKQVSDWLTATVAPKILAQWPKTKNGQLQTNEETLAKFNPHHKAQSLIPYRTAKGNLAKYGSEFTANISPETGRVHCHYQLLGAATGKFSCASPNLMQIPREAQLRRLFVARPGYLFVRADFNQLELRIAAELSQNSVMLDAYATDQDLHRRTAAFANQITEDAVSEVQRNRAKGINFGFIYGQSPEGFATQQALVGIHYTPAEAVTTRKRFFAGYPGLERWQARVARDAQAAHRIVTASERIRLFPPNRKVPATQALNAIVAGTAADILLAALVALDKRLVGLDAHLTLHVHDEIIVEAAVADVPAVKVALTAAMVEAFRGVLPNTPVTSALVEAKAGPDWQAAKKGV